MSNLYWIDIKNRLETCPMFLDKSWLKLYDFSLAVHDNVSPVWNGGIKVVVAIVDATQCELWWPARLFQIF